MIATIVSGTPPQKVTMTPSVRKRQLFFYLESEIKNNDICTETFVLPKCFLINPNQGDEVWSSGFGTADFSSQTRVDNNTLFNIGSVTKSFTATLLGMLLKDNGYVK